jgi:hypothetical protein
MTRHRSRRLFAALSLTIAVGLGTMGPADAAGDQVKLKVHYELAEPPVFDPATSTLELHFLGKGHSSALGNVTVDTHIEQVVTDGCDRAVAHHVISAASGSLVLHGDDRVCPGAGQPDRFIYGVWDVAGGTDGYEGAGGSGVLTAKIEQGGRVDAMFVGVLVR